MGFNVSGINGTNPQKGTNNVSSVSVPDESKCLWDGEINDDETVENNKKNDELQAKLQELEAEKQAKLEEKNILLQNKAAITKRKAAIEAQIKANENAIKANNNVIIANQQKIEAQQQKIEELQLQYDEKCKEAEALNEKINERIAQILAKSEQDVQEATEKIRKATEEAYAKVESGEITEEEVSQYVSNKAGLSNLGATTADFAEINAMNNQIRILTTSAQNISNQMVAAANLITDYQANISSALSSNQELALQNSPLAEQLNVLNSEEADINKEIAKVDREIAKIDKDIAKITAQIEANDTNNFNNADPQTFVDSNNTTNQTTSATTKVNSSNPFLVISYDNAQFTSMVDALNAMVKANEQTITNAQATVAANNEIIRNIFQEQMKK